MIQSKVEQRLLKARTWTLVGVSLLVAIIVGWFVYSYDDRHDDHE